MVKRVQTSENLVMAIVSILCSCRCSGTFCFSPSFCDPDFVDRNPELKAALFGVSAALHLSPTSVHVSDVLVY